MTNRVACGREGGKKEATVVCFTVLSYHSLVAPRKISTRKPGPQSDFPNASQTRICNSMEVNWGQAGISNSSKQIRTSDKAGMEIIS